MNLNTYIDSLGKGGQARFAEMLNVSPGLVWQWLNGRRPISPIQARRIEEVTSGALKREELRPDVFGDAA